MAKKLTIVDFIPPEFDLIKYRALAGHGARGWLTNLVARLPSFYEPYDDNAGLPEIYHEGLGNLSSADTGIDTTMYKFSGDGELVGIEYPDILCNDINLNIMNGADRLLDVESTTLTFIKKLFSSEAIKSLTVGELTGLALGVKSNPELRDIFDYLDNRDIDDDSVPLEWLSVHHKSASFYAERQLKESNPIDYIEVDLRKPSHVLEDEFSIWLEEKRMAGFLPPAKIDKYITKAKFRKWHDARVIPYLDLLQWNQKHGRKLPHSVAGAIIYSDMSDSDLRNPSSMIADTTLKHMKEMLSRETLMLLASQTEIDSVLE